MKIDKLRYELRMYFFLFMLYSFIGWIYETILFSASECKFVNRGFNFGPYIPIYGFGAVLIMLSISFFIGDSFKINNINLRPVAIFLLICILSTVAELIGSLLVEKFLGVMLWDYSKDWMNYQGRIAPRPTMIFGFGGLVAFYVIQPIGKKIIDKVSIKGQRIFALILLFLVITDFTASVIVTMHYPKIDRPGVMGKIEIPK
ncbi:putative ABC transporter permease [Fusobacterium sp. PH5-44]|uniref:putative ABC transporter permease n=1 Tax=unclassified Fusobacterium TaxID=2648384 RepID=UPI003D1CB443